MNDSTHSSLRSQMGPLLFLVGIFLLNFLARIILSPLMPSVEKDLKIGHDEAGSIFLLISLGYCVGLLASGFVSSRLSHRKTIFLSSLAVGFGLMIVSISHNLWAIRSGLIFLGTAQGLYLPSAVAPVPAAPANLEGDLRRSRWISQVVMFGDRKPYPVAIVTLDTEVVVPWAQANGTPMNRNTSMPSRPP